VMPAMPAMPAGLSKQLDPAERSRRRVTIVWGFLFFNVMAYSTLPTLIHIPSHVGKALTQAALVAALVLAVSVNRRGLLRPNVFLALSSVLAITSLMMSLRFVGFGTDYRAVRLVAAICVLWLLTPWFGRDKLVLVKSHLRILEIIIVTVVIGALLAHHKAFAFQGRLTDAIWPVPPPQVAHYAADAAGLTVVLWMCGMVTRRRVLMVVPASVVVLLLTHTRTALIAMLAGLLVAGLSLMSSKRRVRRLFATVIVAAAVIGPGFAPLAKTWLDRGQSSQELTQLTGRTKVWTLLLANPRPETNKILGSGLTNDSFNGLPIDDSWLATYQDQGLFGDVIDASLILVLVITAALRPRGPPRAMALYLIVYCLVASFTETGLGIASPYLLDLTVASALLASGRSRQNRDSIGTSLVLV
jgi:hypothetical protein